MKKFKVWLEEQDNNYVKDAILGVIGDDEILSDEEKEHLMQRNINEFSNDIIKKVKNLGIIKNLADDDMTLYSNIINAINNGIKVSELIEKVSGKNYAPNAAIE
jgi:galactose-1-phosphate uridylyltransferase